eukprot:gene18339-24803_t
MIAATMPSSSVLLGSRLSNRPLSFRLKSAPGAPVTGTLLGRRSNLAVARAASAVDAPTNGIAAEFVTAVAALAPPAPAPPALSVSMPPPAGAYNDAVTAGAAKAAMPAWKIFLMGVQAGVYISFGGFLVVSAFVTAAHLEGKASLKDLGKNWAMSYLGNFVGSLAMVGAVLATGLLVGNPMPAAMATAKCSLTFTQAVVRGILCNW